MLAPVDPTVRPMGAPSGPLSVVLGGIDGWEEYTLPAIRSIWQHEAGVPIVLVGAAAKYPYHKKLDYPDDVHGLRLDPSFSYAGAINAGMAYANADWTVVLNNDVLCTGPFSDLVPAFDPRLLCGMQLIEFGDLRWIGGWAWAISRECREKVGPFDEQFEACGFEDLDYCIRAKALRFPSRLGPTLPFKHLWGKTRWGLNSYPKVRAQNIKRVEK